MNLTSRYYISVRQVFLIVKKIIMTIGICQVPWVYLLGQNIWESVLSVKMQIAF